MFEDLKAGLDEVDALLAGERRGRYSGAAFAKGGQPGICPEFGAAPIPDALIFAANAAVNVMNNSRARGS